MKKHRRARAMLGSLLLLLLGTSWLHALQVPKIFSDHMVLQRDMPVRVWGWAEPGQEVTVTLGAQTKPGRAEADGRWMVELDPMPANTNPAEMTIKAGADSVTLKDILIGEVWVCSGQSNMEWTLDATDRGQQVIATAALPTLRQFKVNHVTSITPQKDLPGEWTVCSPATAARFSGVAFHFAQELQRTLQVPVGLINTSWGGTRIEPWTDPAGFNVSPALKDIADLIRNADEIHRTNLRGHLDAMEGWTKASRAALEQRQDPPDFPGAPPVHPLSQPDRPTAIYNAMVAPLIPYTLRGAIWYQGESNNGEGMLYFEKMKALISSWRRLWAQGDFPFLYVQLAPFRYNRPASLPEIWEAQTAALSITNTGMAVITDISDVNDIHPRNKAEVGRRLALWALAKTYGQKDLVHSGPLYKSMRVEGRKVILSFDHANGLKSLDGKPLTWFTLAGENQDFVDAQAVVEGQTVVVSSDLVEKPVAVRFGWHELAEPNLANGAGLPASPFRTDSR